jgi:signal peptidase I
VSIEKNELVSTDKSGLVTEQETAVAKPISWRAQAAQLAAIVAVVFIAKGALAEPFYVPSGSMEPTLLIGDALLASKFPYGYGAASLPIQITLPETGRLFGETPKRGDVVVFRWPGDRSQAWVKRVVGLPGDRIQLRQGQLFINDHAATLTPAKPKMTAAGARRPIASSRRCRTASRMRSSRCATMASTTTQPK